MLFPPWTDVLLAAETPIRQFLSRHVASRPDIDDIIQEAGARVCLADAEGRLPVNGVGQFMLVSAAAIFNEYVSCGRIAGRELRYTELPSLDDDHAIRQRAKVPTVDRLIELIGDLPSQTRRVFTLHRVYGYAQETIAQRLNISPEAVQDHLARAGRYIFGVLYKGASRATRRPLQRWIASLWNRIAGRRGHG